jgi:dihydroorotate dehydrogenase electron transfer subunit
MLRLLGTTDPLLGRPFALYDTVLDERGTPIGFDVVYLVVGKMTGLLAELKAGESIDVWGPLGNGFPRLEAEHVAFVAGGIGQTPFLAYARELLGTRGYGGQAPARLSKRVSLYYGVRTALLAAGVDDFRAAGCEVNLASDDGTLGFHGFVTQLLARDHPAGPFFGCGPEPMLHALAKLTSSWNAKCYLSLETPMACGVGACFSCVTKVKTPTGWDYKRVCVDGPVFDVSRLRLSESAPGT